MQPLNALDALAPAFTRTHQLLFTPFKLGRSWKLSACAYVAFIGSAFAPFPLLLAFVRPPFAMQTRAPFIVIGVFFTLLLLVFFFFGVRMQFVHFEMVVTRARFIAPMWRRYGARSWPWVGLKAVIGTVITLLSAPLLFARGRAMVEAFKVLIPQFPVPAAGAPPDPVAAQQAIMAVLGQFIEILLPFYLLVGGIFIVLKLVSTLLEDFALPFYILDEVSLFASISRGARVIAQDPLQVVLYLITKFVLSILGAFGVGIASQLLGIPGLIVSAVLGLIAGGIGYALTASHATHAGAIAAGIVVGYGFLIVYTVWSQIFLFGYLMTLLEAYAIYFLGGRYAKLGDYLEPPAYTYAPPPMPPSKDEDEGSGPPLPMDPALA